MRSRGYSKYAMTSRYSIRLLSLSAFCIAAFTYCPAQDTKSASNVIVVPEKVMAAQLSNFVAPKVSKPPLANKCSNALATLKVDVDESGKVTSATFLSGFDELKGPSLDAVTQWRYKPYKQRGHPVAVETRVSIFYLRDGETFPMYSPNGKDGVKGGDSLPLPPGCNPGPVIKRSPS